MAIIQITAIAAVLAVSSQVSSFTPTYSSNNNIRTSSSTQIFSLIKGEAENFDENEGGVGLANEGGVGLAKRCAIKVIGSVSEGNAETEFIARYEKLQSIDKSVIDNTNGVEVLSSGQGKENYQDPGNTNRVEDRIIQLAPVLALQDAIKSMSSSSISEDKSLIINFLGGDDLIIGEVLQACNLLVDSIESLPAKTKVTFNSMAFAEIESDVCSVTVVASESKTGGLDGVDESVARGEVYVMNDKWYTVTDDDCLATRS